MKEFFHDLSFRVSVNMPNLCSHTRSSSRSEVS